MKKNLILFACMACLFGITSVKAENAKSVHYREGYRADVELSCNIHEIWHFSSSHGYAFGNGLYVGGGAGFSAEYVPDLKRGRFTIKGGYEYQLGFWRYNDGVSKHHIKCGLAFNF